MNALWVLVIVAIVVAMLIKLAWANPRVGYRKKQVMHDSERKLFERLTEALPDHLVLAQVSMSAFVNPEGTGKAWQRARNFISQKYVDYLVCDQAANPLAVVELDGKSHQRSSRRHADNTKDVALGAAGIKVIRWTPQQIPKGQGIRDAIFPPPLPAIHVRPGIRVAPRMPGKRAA